MTAFIEVTVITSTESGVYETPTILNVDHIVRVSPAGEATRVWLGDTSFVVTKESYRTVLTAIDEKRWPNLSAAIDMVLLFIEQNPGCTTRDLMSATLGSSGRVAAAIQQAENEGRLRVDRNGRSATYWLASREVSA